MAYPGAMYGGRAGNLLLLAEFPGDNEAVYGVLGSARAAGESVACAEQRTRLVDNLLRCTRE